MKKSFSFLCVMMVMVITGCASMNSILNPASGEAEESVIFNEKRWNDFKNMQPYVLKKSTGNDEADALLRAYASLSNQVNKEIVVPFRELDKEGYITDYFTINKEAEDLMKDNPNLKFIDAAMSVRAEWMKDAELKIAYERVQKAIPEIEKLASDEQMQNSIKRLQKEAENYGKSKLVRKLNDIGKSTSGNKPLNKWQVVQLTANVAVTSVPTIWGLGFLANVKWEEAKAWKEVEEMLKK